MSRSFALPAVLCALITPMIASAQPAQGGGGFRPAGGQGMVGGGAGGGMPGAQMNVVGGMGMAQKERTLGAIKEQLGVTDDEWEKLSPKIEKVLDAKRNTTSGAGLSWSSTNGGAPVFKVSNGKMDTPLGKAMQDVRDAVDDKDTPPDEITKRIAALKEARERAKAEYVAAQKELSDVLTPRQQAILSTIGTLE